MRTLAGRRWARDERGSVSAELAVALPAALIVFVLGVGMLSAASRQIVLQDAAADAARLVARGDDHARAASVVAAADGTLSVSYVGDLACADVTATMSVGSVRVPLAARSCALDGGL